MTERLYTLLHLLNTAISMHSIKSNRNWSATLGSLRLLGQISRIIQNRLEDERRGKQISIDRKLKIKIDEKKQAQGLKQG